MLTIQISGVKRILQRIPPVKYNFEAHLQFLCGGKKQTQIVYNTFQKRKNDVVYPTENQHLLKQVYTHILSTSCRSQVFNRFSSLLEVDLLSISH